MGMNGGNASRRRREPVASNFIPTGRFAEPAIRPRCLAIVRLELGIPVRCADAAYGELADVVIDPTQKRVTHIVVRPQDQEASANRLVPVELMEATSGEREIILRCTVDDVNKLDTVQEFAYFRVGEFPTSDPKWDVGVSDVLASPYYEGSGFGEYVGDLGTSDAVSYDRVPKGEVEVRRASPVYSADEHHLGHVEGFVVDGEDHITHVVLERGHLWGKRDVTIPIGAVAEVESDLVTLSLSKDEVGALKAVRVHRWR
jgi:sporulation protein YlmC with PRC-barrel domain